jgi:hypothetical protein
MKWIDINNKPENDCVCLIVNMNYGMEILKAIYYKHYDVFIWYCPSVRETIVLQPTHYIIIPDLPK